MALYYHKLSNEKYANFLSEGRYDSITKEPFKDGDKVAICSHCKSASLLDVWLAYDKKHCNQEHSEIELDGNIGERYSRFTINSEPIESANISRNIWYRIIFILLFIPLFIIELIVNIFSFIVTIIYKIGRWLLVFLLYLIGLSIMYGILIAIISWIFDLSPKSIDIAVGITVLLSILGAIDATNERLE